MRFEVPQFIDVEEKIFGPFTFKQFIYLLGGGALAYVSFKLIPFPFWIIVSGAFVALGLLLAFYKLNNRPFIEIAQSYISFKLKGKLYIWKKSPEKTISVIKTVDPAPETSSLPKKHNIDDLAKNLDILDN